MADLDNISLVGTSYSLYGPDRSEQTSSNQTGSTLLFIHGVGLNRQVWQPQIEHFAERHKVLVYDMLGHGNSRQPDDAATLDDYVAQLAQFLDRLGIDQVTVIGHSMGALVSVAFALANPLRVTALVPMNIVYQRTQPQRDAVMARAAKVLSDGQVTGVEAALARWFADKNDPVSLERIAAVGHWLVQADPLGYGRTYRLFANSDDAFTGRLHELTMPVLYLTGERDPNSTPAMSQQMAAETPNGQAVTVPDEAHMMAYISPEKVNPILEDFFHTDPLSRSL